MMKRLASQYAGVHLSVEGWAMVSGERRSKEIDGKLVGQRLRIFRRESGMSLHDVELRSGGEFRESVLGAYERGARNLSLPRLARLAAIYGVPLEQLLIGGRATAEGSVPPAMLSVDLAVLERSPGPVAETVRRSVSRVCELRGDRDVALLVLRGEDLGTIARLLGLPPSEAAARLAVLGLASTGLGPR